MAPPPVPPVPQAPAAPVLEPPRREPGSVRRTSHVDMHWDLAAVHDHRFPWEPTTLHLRGAARDALTDRSGALKVLGSAAIDARVGHDGTLAALETVPQTGDAGALLGVPVRHGFRRLAAGAYPDAAGTALGQLLDDLPVATLIAGYARVRRALAQGADPGALSPRAAAEHQADLCAGWAAGGTMIQGILAGRGIPYRAGPLAPPPAPGDPGGWHDEPALPPGAMRRRRRIDVVRAPAAGPAPSGARDGGGAITVHAMFRDTWMDLGGREEVLHEYEVRAMFDAGGTVVAGIVAEPRVLPFGECPGAAAAVGRLVGHDAADLRATVRQTLFSTDSCTHLNDLLRALGDVPALAALLPA
jgi:hypothetical protein